MARVDPRDPHPRTSCRVTVDSSILPRYGDCDEDRAAAAERGPDVANWRDATAAASSPGCCM